MNLYNTKTIYPIIFMNNSIVELDKDIPVLHIKFLYNQYYDFIITDKDTYEYYKDWMNNNCKKTLIFNRHFDDIKSLCKTIGNNI